MGGDPSAFRALLALLLRLTVLEKHHPGPRLWRAADGSPDNWEIGGLATPLESLPLRNGKYLRVAIDLFLDRADRNYLKVGTSSFQYQVDQDPNTKAWVFRYDYLRQPTLTHILRRTCKSMQSWSLTMYFRNESPSSAFISRRGAFRLRELFVPWQMSF